MALRTNKLAAATAVAAAFSLLATPAAAAELPIKRALEVHNAEAGTVYSRKRDRWRHRGRDDDIDLGDILTGVLILGGIAAIAGAADKDEPEPYRYPEPAADVNHGAQGRFESRGMDRAVDMCVAEVENRGERVGSVDSAARTGEGWHVAGALDGGSSYACWIGNDGQISDVEVGGGYSASADAPADGQWSDEAYAKARAEHGMAQPYPAGEIGG